MEQKKSYQADLEHRRTTGFLLGLIFVFSLFIVAMDYTSAPPGDEMDEEMVEDIVQDLEFYTEPQQDMMLAPLPETKQVTEKINPVEQILQQELPDLAQQQQMTEQLDKLSEKEDDPQLDALPVDEKDQPLDFRVVEKIPEPPGGWVGFMKWLTTNLRYPVMAEQRKIQGKVIVSFIVNKDGTTSDVKLEKSAHALLDREALRVLRMMQPWTPGEDMGKPCRTMVAIPVIFDI